MHDVRIFYLSQLCTLCLIKKFYFTYFEVQRILAQRNYDKGIEICFDLDGMFALAAKTKALGIADKTEKTKFNAMSMKGFDHATRSHIDFWFKVKLPNH